MITLTNARQLEQALNDFILECRYGAHPCEGCKFYKVCLKLQYLIRQILTSGQCIEGIL